MLLPELLGKKITNIFQVVEYEHYGMDSGECFIELNNKIIIEIPYSFSDEVRIKPLTERAVTIFSDLSDYPVYHVNPEGKSIKQIIEHYPDKKTSFVDKLKHLLFKQKPGEQQKYLKEYEPYEVEYRENKLKYIKDSVIKDLITFGEEDEKAFLELENGYFISETNYSNNGTGRVGLNLYDNIEAITKWKGKEFQRLSNRTNID